MLLRYILYRINMSDTFEKILLLSIYNYSTETKPTIRKLTSFNKLTERESELAASSLLSKDYIETNGFLSPNEPIKITDSGKIEAEAFISKFNDLNSALNYLRQQIKLEKKEERALQIQENAKMKESHQWVASRWYGDPKTPEGITRTKMIPLGGTCKICKIHSSLFKAKPTYCIGKKDAENT